MSKQTDIAVIGGGIVGLATAYRITQRRPELKVTVLEKEAQLAHHQTGHNSGVLHSGIYYKPGSLKAINCREGLKAMVAFAQEHDIPYEICGKVIVATHDSERGRMQKVYERGQANGIDCRLIDQAELKDIEPHAGGVAGIAVSETGIIDYKQVCEKLSECVTAAGQHDAPNQVLTNAKVRKITRGDKTSVLHTPAGDVEAGLVVNCAGLHCDRVTKLAGDKPVAKIVPFRGEYFELKPDKHHLCRHLIYPVPDPKFPFLGVHFTRMIHGGVECGPNAVPALAREGYTWGDISPRDLFETLTYFGFMRMGLKHWKMGTGEIWRSINKKAFVKALQKLMPEIQLSDMTSCPAGVRAQALKPDGELVDDFVILEDQPERFVHVNNAPSPAATASLNIGKLITDKVVSHM